MVIDSGTRIPKAFFVLDGDHDCRHGKRFCEQLCMHRHEKKLEKGSDGHDDKEICHDSVNGPADGIPHKQDHDNGSNVIYDTDAIDDILCPITVEGAILCKIIYPVCERIDQHQNEGQNDRKLIYEMKGFLQLVVGSCYDRHIETEQRSQQTVEQKIEVLCPFSDHEDQVRGVEIRFRECTDQITDCRDQNVAEDD